MKVRLRAIYDAHPFDGTWGRGREICGLAPTLLSFSVKDEELQMGTILIMRRDGGVDEVMPGDFVLQMDERTFALVKAENFDRAYEPAGELHERGKAECAGTPSTPLGPRSRSKRSSGAKAST